MAEVRRLDQPQTQVFGDLGSLLAHVQERHGVELAYDRNVAKYQQLPQEDPDYTVQLVPESAGEPARVYERQTEQGHVLQVFQPYTAGGYGPATSAFVAILRPTTEEARVDLGTVVQGDVRETYITAFLSTDNDTYYC